MGNYRTAIFAGSFDPFTLGHKDIVDRGLKLFDDIIIAIGNNPAKSNRYFDIQSTINAIESVYENNPNIKVVTYNMLTADLAKEHGANYILRGLRNTTDFEYENSISQVNRKLGEDNGNELETVFLITTPEVAWVASSILRELHKYQTDISKYLPYDPYTLKVVSR